GRGKPMQVSKVEKWSQKGGGKKVEGFGDADNFREKRVGVERQLAADRNARVVTSNLPEDGYCGAVNSAGSIGGKEGDHIGNGAGRDPSAVIGVGECGAVLRSVNG